MIELRKGIYVDIVLSAEQKALLHIMEHTKEHIFITGKAGAGKSVLLRHFRDKTAKRLAVAAPTGIAALNVKASTIHSLFKLGIGLQEPEKLQDNTRLDTILSRIDTLVLDEISMVRADIMDAIDMRFRNAHKKDIAFGGVQVIMFGDPFQLPPVVERGLVEYFEDTYGGHFFFNAKVWKNTEFKVFELSQVFRQKDPAFRDILNAVRNGTVTDEQVEQLNSRHEALPEDGTVTLAPTNELVARINQENLSRLPGRVKEYKATITGDMKKGTFPTEEYLQLKVGAQIVLLKNDKDGRWVNGSVGKVESLHEDHIDVRVGDQVSRLERESWEETVYEYVKGKVEATVGSSFTQYPVKLAWGLTVHKSQGQTYERVLLDLSTGVFAAGQLYVALSRCTSLEGLWLKRPVKREYVIVDSKVVEFMRRCEAIVVEEESVAVEEQAGEVEAQAVAEALAIIEEAKAFAGELYGGDNIETATIEEAQIVAKMILEDSQRIDQAATTLPDESSVEQSLMVVASVESVTVEPLDSETVEQSYGETVEIAEEAILITVEESDQVLLTEGRVARIAAIEVLCPACAGICVDPGSGSTYITPDLIGHSIVCSRCKKSCIVPLNAFSLEGLVIAREKPDQSVSNAKMEKKGRTKKERKSNAGAKSHGKEPKQPLQLSLDMRIIRTLKKWGVNASALYKELLAQYDPFLQQYREVIGEEFGEEESDEEEDE